MKVMYLDNDKRNTFIHSNLTEKFLKINVSMVVFERRGKNHCCVSDEYIQRLCGLILIGNQSLGHRCLILIRNQEIFRKINENILLHLYVCPYQNLCIV